MDLQELISLSLEETLSEIYTEMGITTGDITPLQASHWNIITQATANLFTELIKQNMEEK